MPEDPSPAWSDAASLEERDNWLDPDLLQGQELRNRHMQLITFGWIVIVFLVAVALVVLGGIFALSVHYLFPVSCHWLTDEQLSKVQSILFSGLTGGVVSVVMQRFFRDKFR